MKAWVDRKLSFTTLVIRTHIWIFVNPEFNYLYEALSVPEIYNSPGCNASGICNTYDQIPGEFTHKALEIILMIFSNGSGIRHSAITISGWL